MKIKDLFPDERPREKMLQRGAKALSNSELIACLLGTGTDGMNALDVARELLRSSGGRLMVLANMPLERVVSHRGMGRTKALLLGAAMELGRRCFEESTIADKKPVTTPDTVYRIMIPILRNLDHEECWGIFLNRASYVISKDMLSSGSLDATVIDSKTVLNLAIQKQATSVILVHNHPSGSPLPGRADTEQTERLRKALRSVEITLLDHVIVCEDSFFSFSEDSMHRL